jgi:MFS transporter, YQGE family, putative transporter
MRQDVPIVPVSINPSLPVKKSIWQRVVSEWLFFKAMPHNVRVLLATNLVYAFVLPVIDIFVGAYIMRSSHDSTLVVTYQLAVYTGIPITFFVNGFLLGRVKIATLYSMGMLLSGVSMMLMMTLQNITPMGVGIAGLLMGCSFGFFWSNRDYLTLSSTTDANRNYFYGLETFFYTLTFIVVPLSVGVFLGRASSQAWFGGNFQSAYQVVTAIVFVLTILSSMMVRQGDFKNPVQKKFLFWSFHTLWRKMLVLAGLKGLAQGYLVTAPAILIMTLVGNEHALGTVQAVSGVVTAFMLYTLGRFTQPRHRIYILAAGLFVFFLGTFVNALLFSATGVIVFVLCKVLFQPLHDIAYFPIQMKVIDVVSKIENRNEFAYIFNHEFGLYVGRCLGLVLFITLAAFVSEVFALKYSLLVIALLQLAALPLARNIVRQSNQLSQ